MPSLKLLPFFGTALIALSNLTSTGQVIISEFMADNERTLRDDLGAYSDWIEVFNKGTTNVNLLDWGLSDDPTKPFLWRFPAVTLASGNALVVFASGLDRRNAEATLHTNFKLSAGGEYLALTRPDGSKASEFADYPPQVPDVSFGFGRSSDASVLLGQGCEGVFQVPTDGRAGNTWTDVGFDETGWTRATNAIGFQADDEPGLTVRGDVLADAPLGYWRLETLNTGGALLNEGSLADAANGVATSSVATTAGPRPPGFPGFDGLNQAASFDGSGGYVQVPYSPSLNPQGPFTVEAWVRPRAGSGVRCVLSSADRPGSARRGYVIYCSAEWEFNIGDDNGYVATLRGGVPQPDVWTHLAGVFHGDSASLYVNGVLMSTVGTSRPFKANPVTPFRIGIAGNNATLYFFQGDVDEVAFFDRALTGTEVADRYKIATASGNAFAAVIKTDVGKQMRGVNSSVYFRLPFTVPEPATLSKLTLRVLYHDGFAAWLNGGLAASDNSPVLLSWDSAALAERSVAESLQFSEFDLSGHIGQLRSGTNLLALQGLTVAATNSDFLLLAELTALRGEAWQSNPGYFTQPTPGQPNGPALMDLGPKLGENSHSPALPGTNDNLVVTCRVLPTLGPVANVTLHSRVMFGAESSVPMFDDGLHGDGLALDGTYGAVLTNQLGATRLYKAGEMVRWFFSAADSQSRTSRWPAYVDPANSEEYFGTVIEPAYVTSSIPIIHLFVENYSTGAGVDSSSKTGGRAAVYYDGEFYDNVLMRVRGNTTAGYFKKSHRIDFNSGHKFRHPGPGGLRLSETSFTADYPDPSYLRQRLSFWLCEQAGAPGPFYHPVRLQMNGAFYQLANHNDLHGEDLLERLGYDPNGALYNAAGTIVPGKFSTGGFNKKTRRWDGDSDYTALANAISESLPLGQRETNVFDLLDLPQVISYMAAARFVHENDDVWANMSVYHDNDGDGLWRIIAFDMNLSWGAAFLDSSADDGLQVTNDLHKSFPMYGSSKALSLSSGNWNRLYDVVFSVPRTREMYLRRLRSLLDEWVKPPGTPAASLRLEPMILQWRDEIAAEAATDRAYWGWPPKGGQCNFSPGIELDQGVDIMVNGFINGRRAHFYGKHSITNTALAVGISKTQNAGIPLAQAADAVVSIVSWDYNPLSGNQDEEYVCLTNENAYAVDVSGWRVAGGIQHQLQRGTVLPAHSALYLSPNVAAFRARTKAPRGGMGLFVQGAYSGRLSAWGESLSLLTADGRLVSSASYPGTPSLAQEYLRIVEIMYHPAPSPAINSDQEQFEYIELKNISTNVTLDLANVRLVNGVQFNFTGSAVTQVGPEQSVLVVRNPAAFAARYGPGLPVAGQFTGALNNGGEELRLEDVAGEKILEFSYDNSWYPVTDGLGFALVVVDEHASWKDWGKAENWRAGSVLGGSPGVPEPAPFGAPPVRVNEVLAHPGAGQVDFLELCNLAATNVDVGGWLLTDDRQQPARFRIPVGTSIPANGYLTFTADQFGVGANGFGFSSYGEGAYLFETDAQGNLTGFMHGFEFGASPEGLSFGRHLTSEGTEHFVLQSVSTPNLPNAPPRIGPVVVSEIMYHPDDARGTSAGGLDEYLELLNISGTNVPLYCLFTNEPGYGIHAATNTWRLHSAIDYDFPPGAVLPAAGHLLVVGFDPQTNAARLAQFRARYGIREMVPLFGPWRGRLDDAGETIQLLAPDKPDVTPTNLIIPYVLQEQIAYRPTLPWPPEANGQGPSLQRVNPLAYGNDPVNWFAAFPAVGVPPRPFVVQVHPAGQFVNVTVSAVPGFRYGLEYKNDLADAAWSPAGPSAVAANEELVLIDPVPHLRSRFYRVFCCGQP